MILRVFRRIANRTRATGLLVLLASGCTGDGGGQIMKAPADWSQYAGSTVTVRGTAGNTPTGPIVRLPYGGYVAINGQQPWGIAYVTRPVAVKGKIVSGAGTRTEAYVLQPQTIEFVAAEVPHEPTDKTPESGS